MWLAGLLANKKVVTPLFEYLKVTKVGSREGPKEKEQEWRRKNN